nr:uncharacterized mitochondrial protein AtMg00810-like [Tanacetum cinerariifolium]
HQKDWYHTTQLVLEEKVRILSANLENTTNTLKYSETLYDQAKLEKKEWRTKLGLGFKEFIGSDDVCDLSTPSVFDPEPDNREGSFGSKLNTSSIPTSKSNDFVFCDNNNKSSASETYEFASCVSSPKTNDSLFTVNIKLLLKFNVKDPSLTNGLPSCSFMENVKPHRNLCNKSGTADRIPYKNNFVRTKKCFVCGCKSHLIKDCHVYDTVDNVPSPVSKAASVLAGSRNSLASTSAGKSIPAANRNISASIHAGRPIPTASRKRPASIHAGKHIPAGRINKPAPFPAGISVPTDIGIIDSGCSRSITGNKEKLDDFVQVKGGTVTFGGGDGKITGKGTIRTSNLDFENVYYMEELQNFNLFSVSQICDKKNKVLFIDDECLVLIKEFQLPDESQVVLRIPRRHDLYTFNLSDIQPEQHINCLLAKTSLEECQVTILNTSDHLGKFEGKATDSFLVGQEYEAHSAAAKHGFEFYVDTAALLPQAKIVIRRNLVLAAGDPAGSIVSASGVPTGSVPASSVPAGGVLAGSIVSTGGVPAGSVPASSVPAGGVLAGSIVSAGFGDSAASASVLAVFLNAPAATSPLPPGHSLGSCKHTTRFPSPSDLGYHQPTIDIFSSSSYDADFCDDITSLASNVVVDPVATKRVNIIHPQSQIIRVLQSPIAIGTKWILKNKKDARGIVVRNKARLVTQGHRQEEGIYYDEVYVDDIIFGSTNKAWCDEFEVLMKGEFEMSAMGEMTFFLGLQVKQLPDGIFISQDKYVKDMLKKFDIESVRTATTPYEVLKHKSKDEPDDAVNVYLFRSMIGSLMYLIASRPDIMFAVSACSRHQVTPLTSHVNEVKKIFKYLKGQPKLGLCYPRDSPFQLEAYSDSDYAGSHGDRKSTTGGFQFLGRRLISWQCKKQTAVATSSTEAKYVAAASCCG